MSGQRTLGQILEKPSVPSSGHTSNLIVMKLGQNVFHDEISDKFKSGCVLSKTRSQGQIIVTKGL